MKTISQRFNLKGEDSSSKELVAELSLENHVLKKNFKWCPLKTKKYKHYNQTEKMEIKILIEQSEQ